MLLQNLFEDIWHIANESVEMLQMNINEMNLNNTGHCQKQNGKESRAIGNKRKNAWLEFYQPIKSTKPKLVTLHWIHSILYPKWMYYV